MPEYTYEQASALTACYKEIARLRAELENLRKFKSAVVGWREYDWPDRFDRLSADMVLENALRVSEGADHG